MSIGEAPSQPRQSDGPIERRPRAEPIPGYRLLEPLGKGGFGEVWKCQAPGGIHKAIKFVSGRFAGDRTPAEQELNSLQRIRDIRHPFVLSLDRVEIIHGELVIVMELADESLHDLLTESQAAGLPGIPRPELLAYLCEAAEALDLMNLQHGLQHLDVKPRNLFLVSRHVKVGDFGLVNTLRDSQKADGSCLGGITPQYAPPETFAGIVTATSDQYSLAIVYQELLTGTVPFKGRNARQLAFLHTQTDADLGALAEDDRLIVGRALAKNPNERYPSCLDFMQALILGKSARPEGTGRAKRFQVGASALIKRLQGLPEMDGFSGLSSFLHPRPRLTGRPQQSTDNIHAETGALRQPTHQEISLDTTPGEDPLQGIQFLKSLNRGPLGELWKVETPDHRPFMLRLVYGYENLDRRYEEEAVQRLAAIEHHLLAPMQILRAEPGRLALAMDLVEETLFGRMQRAQAEGWAGVPRDELLEHLRGAAMALDALHENYGVQHLGLNPRNLLLRQRGLLIADFGLVQLLFFPAGKSLASLNPRYAAPELFDQKISPCSDQYTLAIIFQELLTGVHPFHGRSLRQISGSAGRAKPDLDSLRPADREVIARAMRLKPEERFPACRAMVDALLANNKPVVVQSLPVEAGPQPTTPLESSLVVTELVTNAAGPWQLSQYRCMRYLLHPGEGLLHKCGAQLLSGTLHCKLQTFCQEWNARILQVSEEGFRLQVSLQPNFWQSVLGRRPGLEIKVKLNRPRVASTALSEVTIHIRPVGCNQEQGQRLIEEVGPLLLDSLRGSLQANPERRVRQRLRFDCKLKVSPIYINSTQGPAIEARGKDLSDTGIGLYLPHEPPSSEVCLYVPTGADSSQVAAVNARVVRVQPCADGWYEIGARFFLDDPLHLQEHP